MTDDDFPGGGDPALDRSAAQPLDAADLALLAEVSSVLTAADPVPDDLVERIQFALALDEVYAEVAQITRLDVDAHAVRSEAGADMRTETLTFSTERLTVMLTISRSGTGPDPVRLDGWVTPAVPLRIQLRMQEGTQDTGTDETGRFVLEGVPEGFAQLTFSPADGDEVADDAPGGGVVVTPLFQL